MSAKAAEQRIKVLEIQNKRLSEKVEVQKTELAQRQKRIEAQEARWRDAQAAVFAVRRGWTQLHEDIHEIADRAGLTENLAALTETATFLDPLLTKLTSWSGERTNADGEMHEDDARTHAEEMQKLAEAADVEIKNQAKETVGVLAEMVTKLQSKRTPSVETVAAQEVDAIKATIRAMQERVRLTQDTLTRRESELKEIRCRLSDTQYDLETAQRKILSYKNSISKETTLSKSQSKHRQWKDASEGLGFCAGVGGKEETAEDQAANKAVQNLCVESLIRSKIEELERERKEHQKTQKELRSLQLDMKSDSWVKESRLYQSLHEQKTKLMAKLENKAEELLRAQAALEAKDREISKKRSHDPDARLQSFTLLKEAQKKLKELQQQIMENEKAHQSRSPPSVDPSTAEEYDRLLAGFRQEAARLSNRLKDCVWDTERVQKARKEAVEAGRRMRAAENRMERLNSIAKEHEDVKRQTRVREEQLLENRDDLQVYVDVLMTYDAISKNRREADSIARDRNTERKNSSLKRKIEELEKTCGNEDLQKDVESSRKRIRRLKEKMDHLHVEMEEVNRTNKHQKEDLEQQKQLNTYLQEELEQTGAAYEKSQMQNEKLLKQLGEKDRAIIHLRQEKAKIAGRVGVLTSLAENLEIKVRWDDSQSEEMSKIRSEYSGRLEETINEIARLKEEMQQLQEKLNAAQRDTEKIKNKNEELHDQVKEAKHSKEEQRKAAEVEIERCVRERAKCRKMEADVKALEDLKRKLRSGTLKKSDVHQEQEMEMLNQEVESLRNTLTCSICSTRRKSVVLMKCLHTFCKPCIENRIDTRSRRCPGCGSAFSREDVRDFFLT